MGYLSEIEIKALGLKEVGRNVKISDKASFYNVNNISIGSNVRIDDFCILSAGPKGINIGSHVHMAAYSSIVGSESVTLEDFVGLSAKVSIFSSSDDYMGYALTNPTVPDKYRRVKSLPVVLRKHSLVGANSVLLPGAFLEEGVSIGALTVVSSRLESWNVYLGNPAKKVVRRSKSLLAEEDRLNKELSVKS